MIRKMLNGEYFIRKKVVSFEHFCYLCRLYGESCVNRDKRNFTYNNKKQLKL